MSDQWIEVAADGLDLVSADDVATRFADAFGDDVVVEERPDGDVSVRAFLRDGDPRTGCVAALERDLSGTPLRVGPLVDRNWGDAWREVHEPIAIGERLVVQAPWLPTPSDAQETVVRIDPGMAFGVGTHASTRLALEVLAEIAAAAPRAVTNTDVLDVGAGTGILSLSALGLGAAHATLCDIDPHAAEAVRRNTALNDCDDKLAYFRGSPGAIRRATATPRTTCRPGFDLVLANIVAPILLQLLDDLAAQMRPGATLILSGIFDAREPEIVAAASARTLAPVARIAADGFVALAFRREPPGDIAN